MKFGIQMDWMVPFTKTLEQIDHMTQEGTTWPHDLGGMMQVADEGLQIPPGTPVSIPPRLKQRLLSTELIWGETSHLSH